MYRHIMIPTRRVIYMFKVQTLNMYKYVIKYLSSLEYDNTYHMRLFCSKDLLILVQRNCREPITTSPAEQPLAVHNRTAILQPGNIYFCDYLI